MYSRHIHRQKGSVLALMAVLIPVLIMFVGLALDLSRFLVVKNELKRAADAAAIAGAGALPFLGGSSSYDWPGGIEAGQAGVSMNTARTAKSQNIVNGAITYPSNGVRSGWWDLNLSTLYNSGISPGATPPSTGGPYAAAVEVTTKLAENSGLLEFFFSAIYGDKTADMKATSVAVIAVPGSGKSEAVYPLKIDECLFANYWNTINSTGLSLAMGPGVKYDKCPSTGDFFGVGSKSVSDIVAWIQSAIVPTTFPPTISLGDTIAPNTGDPQPPLKSIRDIITRTRAPITTFIPVVTSSNTVLGFAAIQINCANTNASSNDYGACNDSSYSAQGVTQSYMGVTILSDKIVPVDKFPSSATSGTYYGTYLPPMLAL